MTDFSGNNSDESTVLKEAPWPTQPPHAPRRGVVVTYVLSCECRVSSVLFNTLFLPHRADPAVSAHFSCVRMKHAGVALKSWGAQSCARVVCRPPGARFEPPGAAAGPRGRSGG